MAVKTLTENDKIAAENLRRHWADYQEIYKARYHKKVTQEMIAGDLGMTQSAVSQFILGKTPLSRGATIKFSRLFGIHPAEIHPDFELMVAEDEGRYSYKATGETKPLTQEETEKLATQYALVFVDLADDIIGEKLPTDDKADIFQHMKDRYIRQLQSGQQLPDLQNMQSEVADFMKFYKLRNRHEPDHRQGSGISGKYRQEA